MTMLHAPALQNGHSKHAGGILNLESNHVSDTVFLTTFLTL